ncbi:MAG: HEAT repeat domain-containing protein [Actinomycetota bacterium]
MAERRRLVALAGHRGDEAAARAGRHDTDPHVRALALGALDRLGALDDDEVRSALDDPSPLVRRAAATLATTRPDVDLVTRLGDDDPDVAEVAAWACGERTDVDPTTISALVEMATGHDEPLCREAAIAALGAIGDPAGLEAILAGTTDRPAVRRRAIVSLAPFEGSAVDEALRRALDDRDWQVRQAAEDLLEAGGDAEPRRRSEERDRARRGLPEG